VATCRASSTPTRPRESCGRSASIEHYETSLELRPDAPNTLYNLGLAYEMLDKEAEALERFRRAARLDPTSEAARHLAESHPGEL
jgi:tetratricopeptide (TPR) repeat protein